MNNQILLFGWSLLILSALVFLATFGYYASGSRRRSMVLFLVIIASFTIAVASLCFILALQEGKLIPPQPDQPVSFFG